MKRILCMALALMVCLCLMAMPALAASASATLTGPGTVRAGDTITLSFKLTGAGIFGVQGALEYNSDLLELKKTEQKIQNGWAVEFNDNLFMVYDNNQEKPINSQTELFTLTFKVKSSVAAGTQIQVKLKDLIASDEKVGTKVDTVTYFAIIAAPKSTDNSLKSLTVANATISPAFRADTTSYTAEVPFEVSKLDVKAVANDSKATVKVDSPTLTPDGTTKVTITVTAESGSKKTYTITVKRAKDPNYVASSNNELAGITVDDYVLSPVFAPDKDRYVIWLPYETDQVSVSGTPVDSKASVRVEGGSNLTAGADNEIRVICVAENGTEKVYTIIAKRAAEHGSTQPTEPQPTEPQPTEPQPTEPKPTQPQPTQPKPTDPAPTQPQTPCEPAPSAGIPWWSLLIAGVIYLAIGLAAGIFAEKKLLSKK